MKILSKPKGNAEEYGRWSVNPYIGCSHGCLYCYLKSGPSGGYLGQDRPVLKRGIVCDDHAYHLAMAEILVNREQIIRDGGLFMTFTSDPYLPETRSLTSRIVKDCISNYVVPVTLLTKRADFLPLVKNPRFEDVEHCKEWAISVGCFALEHETLNSRLATGFTLTGHDELEPNASPNADRIKAMRFLHELKLNVWASIEPVIDFDASFRMIQQALDAGCEHFKIGLMTKNTKVCRHGFTLGGKTFEPYDLAECCQFVDYVMELTEGRATVYWKQSVADFLGQSEKDPQPVYGMTAREYLSQWSHSVPKDWSIFAHSPSVQ